MLSCAPLTTVHHWLLGYRSGKFRWADFVEYLPLYPILFCGGMTIAVLELFSRTEEHEKKKQNIKMRVGKQGNAHLRTQKLNYSRLLHGTSTGCSISSERNFIEIEWVVTSFTGEHACQKRNSSEVHHALQYRAHGVLFKIIFSYFFLFTLSMYAGPVLPLSIFFVAWGAALVAGISQFVCLLFFSATCKSWHLAQKTIAHSIPKVS